MSFEDRVIECRKKMLISIRGNLLFSFPGSGKERRGVSLEIKNSLEFGHLARNTSKIRRKVRNGVS